VAELGGDHPVVPPLADGGADELLGQVVAVALGAVNQVDAKLSSRPSSWSTSCWVKVCPHSPPSCQVPAPRTETRRPVLASRRYFMLGPFDRRALLPSLAQVEGGRQLGMLLASPCGVTKAAGGADRNCPRVLERSSSSVRSAAERARTPSRSRGTDPVEPSPPSPPAGRKRPTSPRNITIGRCPNRRHCLHDEPSPQRQRVDHC
jgi:hypothetical protein